MSERPSLFPAAYLLIGLIGTVLLFVLPAYTFWDRFRGDGHAVTTPEVVMLGAFLASRLFVWAYAPRVIEQVQRMRGAADAPLPKANPVSWPRTAIYTVLVVGCIVFS